MPVGVVILKGVEFADNLLKFLIGKLKFYFVVITELSVPQNSKYGKDRIFVLNYNILVAELIKLGYFVIRRILPLIADKSLNYFVNLVLLLLYVLHNGSGIVIENFLCVLAPVLGNKPAEKACDRRNNYRHQPVQK